MSSIILGCPGSGLRVAPEGSGQTNSTISSRFIKIEEPSLRRKTRNILYKVFHDCWASLWRYFHRVPIDSRIESKKNYPKFQFTYIPQVIPVLRKERTLDTLSVSTYGDKLVSQFTQSNFISTYLIPPGRKTPELPQIPEGNLKLMIPVVIKGTLRDHIIAVFFDRRQNTIEIYDPKGLTVMDRMDERPVSDPNTTMPQLIRKIIETYGNSSTTVIENTVKHQYDSHNCGVYTCDYFTRRLKGESVLNIQKGPPKDPSQIRVAMIKRLLS